MLYQDDHELVTVEVEQNRVVGVSIKNTWRDHLSVSELGLELSDQLSRAWAEPIMQRLEAMEDARASRPEPSPQATRSIPAPGNPAEPPSLKHLAAIGAELEKINGRIRKKLHDPHYFDDLEPPKGEEFTSRDGNVTLGHFGNQVIGIQLREDYFARANIMSVIETINRAFEEFYSTDHDSGTDLTDHDPELTADRGRLAAIQRELEEA